jgi:glycerol-3-phosphate acyltransferase PlsY
VNFIFLAILAYLIGSLPYAFMISKIKGIDIFKVGTQQAGATNVFRVVSRRLGILVLILDILKGITIIFIANSFSVSQIEFLIICLFCIFGHWNSVFTKFRGGDGLAILIGLMLGISVISFLTCLVIFLVLWAVITRHNNHPTLIAVPFSIMVFVLLATLIQTEITIGYILSVPLVAFSVLFHSVIQRRMKPENFIYLSKK